MYRGKWQSWDLSPYLLMPLTLIHTGGLITLSDYGPPERKQPSLHGRKFNPNPKFISTAEGYFFCHIGPIFQISLISASIGCPYFVTIGMLRACQKLWHHISVMAWWHFIGSCGRLTKRVWTRGSSYFWRCIYDVLSNYNWSFHFSHNCS